MAASPPAPPRVREGELWGPERFQERSGNAAPGDNPCAASLISADGSGWAPGAQFSTVSMRAKIHAVSQPITRGAATQAAVLAIV